MPTAYQAAILAKSPVGYWPLDDAPGAGVAHDLSASALPAARNGPTLGVPGPLYTGGATAALFDGVNDYFDVVAGGGVNPYTKLQLGSERAAEFWANVLGPPGSSDDNANVVLRWRFFGYAMAVGTSGSWQATTAYVPGPLVYPTGWHNVFTRDSLSLNRSELWFDGVLVVSVPYAGDISYTPGGGIAIGRDGDTATDFFNGYISDVALYNAYVEPTVVAAGDPWQLQLVGP